MELSSKLNAVTSGPHAPVGASSKGNWSAAAAVSSEAVQSSPLPAGKEQVDAAVAQVQSFVQSVRRELDFRIDEDSGRVVVKVVARDSGEVIRQIPSEEVLELAAHINDVRSLLFSEQA